jgi:hypothetical protein
MEDLALLLENSTPFRLHDTTTHIESAPSPVIAQGYGSRIRIKDIRIVSKTGREAESAGGEGSDGLGRS